MDAWEILTGNSFLGSGDAWEHLNAQEGDGAGTTLIVGEVEVDVDQDVVEIDVIDVVSVDVGTPDLVEVDVIDAVSVETESDEITVETCE